ncbi:hypothetical protein [Herbiconiux sp. YIM B11900]|uniref:hypothetical protein n=1 Tax=Herbiconiux sp. YIM B11900 TaxID=3404131 RepID=UPI003F839AB4
MIPFRTSVRAAGGMPRRRRSWSALSAGLAAVLAGAAVVAIPAGGPAAALPRAVAYELPNADFGGPLQTGWTVQGEARQERTLELAPGGVAYQGIPVAAAGAVDGVAPGDLVRAEVDVTLHGDVTADSTVLVRVTDGSAILAEWSDLTGLARGQRETVGSRPVGAGRVGAAAGTVYVELHNDTGGTIEFHQVRLWADSGSGERPVALPNAGFADELDGSSNWSSSGARIASGAVLEPGAVVSRAVPVGADPVLPQRGDALGLAVDAFVDPRGAAQAGPVATVGAGGAGILTASAPAGQESALWQELTATPVASANTTVPASATEVDLELRNSTGYPLRLRDVRLSGQREQGDDDLDGNGVVDAADAAWFEQQIAAGTTDPALDYDGDGQVTTKDVSYYVRFVLGDTSEVYANLSHLDFLSEHVELDGKAAMIVHLYAEPLDRDDLAAGYEWVGDPQEGVSALDDVARAVIVYAEHYATYGDAHSYDQMKRGLEFAMWMQAPNGDFDNFVARDADGNLFKKDSASSQTAFSYWAARAYEAMATALPLITDADAELAGRLQTRLQLCLDRVGELVSAEYGQHQPDGSPAWLLFDDSWLSATAVAALVKHAGLLQGPERDAAVTLVSELAEGIAYYQAGDFDQYPLGAIKHSNGNWYEWGSIQTKALALAGSLTGHGEWIAAAELSADSFLSDLLISGRSMEIAPNKSGLPQINYGTASYVENYLALYSVTGETKYADMAGVAATWWMGQNPIGVPMFDQSLGLAFDGITIDGLNSNSGAESVDEALRAILRVQRVPEALAVMTATKVEERTATTVEIEDLVAEGRPADAQLDLPDGGLNDPARAVVTQAPASGTDEAAIYQDSLAVDSPQTVYPGWEGQNALFVSGDGYNNVRVFDGGSIQTRIGVGGDGQPQSGDALMLDFAALLQFGVDLDAEVLSVDASGAETPLADDSGFGYNPRTWYSGAGSVRTTLLQTVPDDATAVIVRFSNHSTNPKPYEGYATVTLASLYRLGVPEVRYGSSAFSNRAYAHLEAGSSASHGLDVPTAGAHLLFLSAVDSAAAARPSVSLSSPGLFDTAAPLAGADGAITIRTLGRADLTAGTIPLQIATTPDAAADLDALILYPVETYAIYRLLDGREVMVLRDADARALYAGTPEEVRGRNGAPVEPGGPGTGPVDPGAGSPGAGDADPAAAGSPQLAATGAAPGSLLSLALLALVLGLAAAGVRLRLHRRAQPTGRGGQR